MLTAAEIEEVILFRDAELPASTVQPTPSGDWPSIAGRENFRRATIRRAVTSKGTMVHRPEYGGDIVRAAERPAISEEFAAREVDIEENATRDPRVGEVRVAVEESTTPGRVTVELTVQPLRTELREVVGLELEV